jgi:hypothetical protein
MVPSNAFGSGSLYSIAVVSDIVVESACVVSCPEVLSDSPDFVEVWHPAPDSNVRNATGIIRFFMLKKGDRAS